MKEQQTESQITRAIRDTLKLLGIFNWKAWQGPMSTPGVPDILGVWQGRMLGIEVKKPGNKPTPTQQKFIDRINREGGKAFTAYCVEDVIRELNAGDRFLF